MEIEIAWGAQTTRADLRDGQVRIGGGATDEVRIEGLPPSLVVLHIAGTTVTATSRRPLRIGRAFFAAQVPRLVLPGERLHLSRSVSLARPSGPPRATGTATLMRGLLSGSFSLENTRAARLTCLTGRDAGNTIPLGYEQMLIGRGDDCAVQVLDRAVSRRHARLTLRGSRALLEDLHSPNGTYVNGRRVRRCAPLSPGDVIELGQTVLRYDAAEAAAPPVRTRDAPVATVAAAARSTVPWWWPLLSTAVAGIALVGALVALATRM